ncbi:Glutamine--fructose-6-phosphate aminotransferase [isomerizing] [Candidatus Anstonella stagnisolia]|nr:Glutamine--fructose-6-phosphate aminotransferase [isomerizing] [Candidatus Anstonella stagnisolia]
MCGIVGYIGNKKASLVVLEALKNVEYRGYDSAGIAVLNSSIQIIKDVGKLAEIEKKHNFSSLEGTIGMGHTRWATHGGVNSMNAHPHTDESGEICLVHNGIIENFQTLREKLQKAGCKFRSETDTELMAHLISLELKKAKDFKGAFLSALQKIEGSFSFVVMHKGEQKLYGARKSSPLIIGVGKNEMFFASDMPAVLSHTRDFVFLQENEAAEITKEGYEIYSLSGAKISRAPTHVDWTPQMAQKEGYAHFMIKEISEQQNSIRNVLATDVTSAAKLLKKSKYISIIACGTSYHAALLFKLRLANYGFRSDVVIGSEYSTPPGSLQAQVVDKNTVVVAISQSGETADTLSAVRFAKTKGARIIGITNVIGSSLSREADSCIYTGAGPEISVVATKSFTSQVAILYMLAAVCAGENINEIKEKIRDLSAVIEAVISKDKEINDISAELSKHEDFFFIGRGAAHPVAMEGALKLKEITYLHAEAYAAGELKHGPLSLLEEGIPVIVIAPQNAGNVFKIISSIKECNARGAFIVGISDSDAVLEECNLKFKMPDCPTLFEAIAYTIPLQLLAYHMAIKLDKDPDKPRNLAKSVTVE